MTTTTETQINDGDLVTITGYSTTDTTWEGRTGEAYDVTEGMASVKFTNGGYYAAGRFPQQFLVPAKADEPFTFADIQVGDTIRRTQTFKGGATEVREGTVTRTGSGYATTSDFSYILAYAGDTAKEEVTLELLNRPEPEPVKEVWELAKTGDRLVVKNGTGIIRVLTKQADGLWDCLLIRSYGSSTGITRPDDEVKGQLSNSAFSEDGSYEFFPAS